MAEDLFNRALCLPSGTAMTEEDLDRVIETILNCKKQEGQFAIETQTIISLSQHFRVRE